MDDRDFETFTEHPTNNKISVYSKNWKLPFGTIFMVFGWSFSFKRTKRNRHSEGGM